MISIHPGPTEQSSSSGSVPSDAPQHSLLAVLPSTDLALQKSVMSWSEHKEVHTMTTHYIMQLRSLMAFFSYYFCVQNAFRIHMMKGYRRDKKGKIPMVRP